MGVRGGEVWMRTSFLTRGLLAIALLLIAPMLHAGTGSHGTFGRSHPANPGVFSFCNGTEPEVLDPALMSGQPDGRIARAIFEGLVVQDPRTLEAAPGVARSWEISSDGRRYTFHLRGDARWTNGERVTARDFEWSLLRVLHPDTPARNADILYVIHNAQAYKKKTVTNPGDVGIHALDDSTLALEL